MVKLNIWQNILAVGITAVCITIVFVRLQWSRPALGATSHSGTAADKDLFHSAKQRQAKGTITPTPAPPIMCKLTPAEFQKRRSAVLHKLKAQVKEQKNLSNGFALRFDGSEQRLEDLTQLLRLERDCCSFLTIKITALPNNGPLWLEITGPSGTKAFIKDEMGLAT